MKKIVTSIFLTAFFTISAISVSHAQQADKDVGIGFMVGEPTGLSLKSWTGGNNAFDVGLAWSLNNDAVHLHADYLWHNFDLFNDVEAGSLPLYYGIGGRVVFDDDDDAMGGGMGIDHLMLADARVARGCPR